MNKSLNARKILMFVTVNDHMTDFAAHQNVRIYFSKIKSSSYFKGKEGELGRST